MPFGQRKNWSGLITKLRILGGLLSLFAISALAFAADDTPAPPEAPPVSEFAPMEPLLHQIQFHVDNIATSFEQSRYTESIQSRVEKDANSLITLFMALGLHDEESELKKSAPRLTELAEELAAASTDEAKAKAAYQALAQAMKEGATGGKPLSWEHRAKLGSLMKQVTTINGRLRLYSRSESRYARVKDDLAGYAVGLAVVGQAALVDTHEVKDPSMVDEWYKYASEMRDAAAAVEDAIAKDDFAAVQERVQKLQDNCAACHDVFRIDTTAAAAAEEE